MTAGYKWSVGLLVAAVGLAAGCADDPKPSDASGRLGGLAIVSGPLRGAQVAIDQLDSKTGAVREHVGDAATDDAGHFALDTSTFNGLFLLTTHGGSFVDLASGATVQLDASDGLETAIVFELLDQRDDVLVSPIGHLIAARMREKLAAGAKDATEAQQLAATHLDAHFGNVDWSRARPGGLDAPAPSPTEPVRAALVEAAMSYFVQDVAQAAGASPQEANVLVLARQWAADIGASVFDGNDGNDRALGSGLQLGVCPPVASDCTVPASGCTTGACRTLCDLYVGSPRALLAGVMTKVIGNPDVNKTQLAAADILPVARSMAENLDEDLFGGACVETLDRLPPTIQFNAPTPAEGAFVHGAVMVKATAIDDLDPNPRTQIAGFPDADGDPSNNVAQAVVDTTAVSDGAFQLVATASDMAGNAATLARTFMVDNTAPAVTLAPTGFFVDGTTWWTASATPTLTGTVHDAAPATVKAVIGGVDFPATVSGGTWTLTLPAGTIDLVGRDVALVATDAAGNQASVGQRIRADLVPPKLSFASSTVIDESSENFAIPFDPNQPSTSSFTGPAGTADSQEIPIHRHDGTAINLDVTTGCPAVTKFSYLLKSTGPAFGNEVDAGGNTRRNPIRYGLVTDDDGVGITSGSSEYRLGRRDQSGNTVWLIPFTSAGTGVVISSTARRFDVGVFSDVVASLATDEGTYDVQFRATDRLARTSTVSRCFDLHLRAPPLDFTSNTSTRYGMPVAGPAKNHALALNTLSLAPGASFDKIAARLLNDDATGASLLDQPFINGTAETVFLTVQVTSKPTTVNAIQAFKIRDTFVSKVAVSLPCSGFPDPCDPVPAGRLPYNSSPVLASLTTLQFPVKVFELDANNIPTTEVPCVAPCAPTSSTLKFAIPPRTVGARFRRFVAMTMIGSVSGLWPKDFAKDASPPFVDGIVNSVHLTGIIDPSRSGCTKFLLDPSSGEPIRCTEKSTFVSYRALTHAELTFSGRTTSTYSTAASALLAPAEVATLRRDGDPPDVPSWHTDEGTLP